MKWLLCLAPALFLAGCLQGSGSFPSLAPRPYEVDPARVAERADDPAAAPAAPAETALSYEQRQAIEAAQDQHRAAEAAFRAALPGVRSAVEAARGAATGSEAWVVAQQALSRLEVSRTPSVEALANLDRLLSERLAQEQQGAAGGGAQDITVARAIIAAAVDEQAATIGALAGRIG